MNCIPVLVALSFCFILGCSNDQSIQELPPKADPFLCATQHDGRRKSLEPLAPNVEAARRLSLNVRFNEGTLTLQQFADQVKKTNDVDIWFDWPALAEVGVTPKTTVPIKAGHPDGDRALAALLWYCSPSSNAIYPTYMIVDGLVVVGTNRSLVRKLPQVNWPQRDNPEDKEHITTGIRLKLDQRVVLQGSYSFDQIIMHIAEQTGITIKANWRGLELSDIYPDNLVSINYPHHTAGELLQNAIDQVSAHNFGEDKAAVLIHQGQIHLSTIDDLNRNRVTTKTYGIDDLLISPYGPALRAIYEDDPFALKMLANHNLAWQVRWLSSSHRLWGRQTLTKEEIEGISRFDRQHSVDELMWLIERRTIKDIEHDPNRDRWIDEEWVVRDLDGLLSIKTIEPKHREIGQFLEQLRETRRLTLLRFIREVEATRLLKQAEQARQAGELKRAQALIDKAHHLDPGSDVAWSLLQLLKEQADPDPPSSE